MTSRAQFEAMLEALVEGDQEAAKDIFHNIVVGKSREIYEQLLAEDFDFDEAAGDDEDKEHEGEPGQDDFDFGNDEDGEEDGEHDEFGDDDAEDSDADSDLDDEPLEDRVVDLEDALEDLKAEFERLMADEKNEPEHADLFGGEDEEQDHEGEDEEGDEYGEPNKVFEYVNKVALPKHGDNGVNVKSPVAGKNDMGGTAANIARGGEAKEGGTKGGLLDPTTKDLSGGNVNVPGSNRATKLHNVSKGHGAEKRGASEKADNTRSLFSGKR